MAIVLSRAERDPQRIVDAIIQLTQGRGYTVGDFVLTIGATSTVINFPNCSTSARVFLGGLTAAAIAANPQVAAADCLLGSFVIRHSAAAANARGSFVCTGG